MWKGIAAAAVAAGLVGSVALGRDGQAPSDRDGATTIVLDAAPPGGHGRMSIDLERFTITTPSTRFVLGTRGGEDRPLAFDPRTVPLYRGSVRGVPGSSAFVVLTAAGPAGLVDLGRPDGLYAVAGAGPGGAAASLRRVDRAAALPPSVPVCGTGERPGPGGAAGEEPPIPTYRTQVIELAVETDYELFSLFGDVEATCAYVLQLYAAISDIYLRDVNARFELTFVRIWDDPDDLFNEESPLAFFRNYWNENETEVHRDLAQFISGRRDMPYGGAAYLGTMCGESGYSVCGYLLGSFPDPAKPSVFHYDIGVAAHELGHNCGALHTHSYELDTCDDLNGPPQRGTIMSYCSQTVSGGNANKDLRLHTVVQDAIALDIVAAECLFADCNGNGEDDELEIGIGAAPDVNGNGVPDECEDCNGNRVLDDADIAGGGSDDVNGNGVPDECEPDCNGNGVPDDRDIEQGISLDVWGNGIPDECEADCDGDGVSDYTQIQADMTLDVDRDAVLDGCQDCDGDGERDLVALEGSRACWCASAVPGGPALGFHPLSGVRFTETGGSSIQQGQDLLIDGAGNIYVSSLGDGRVARFDRFGTFLDDLVVREGGFAPTGLAFAPGGHLLVADRGADGVVEFDPATGQPVRPFVAPGDGGLVDPFGLAFNGRGNLLVTSDDGRVLEFDGTSGAFAGELVGAKGNGGLSQPRGLVVKPDGNLLVASFGTNEILEYDGADGSFLGKWNQGGTETALTLDGPWGVRIGPDGEVYVSRNLIPESHGHDEDEHDEHSLDYADSDNLHINATRIFVFDAETGLFLRSYVTGNDTGLWSPSGFDFMPDPGTDCNGNLLPDGCDVAAGTSRDANGNGVPDECECTGDLDGSGEIDVEDLVALILGWGVCPGTPCPADLDGSGEVDVDDLVLLVLGWGEC